MTEPRSASLLMVLPRLLLLLFVEDISVMAPSRRADCSGPPVRKVRRRGFFVMRALPADQHQGPDIRRTATNVQDPAQPGCRPRWSAEPGTRRRTPAAPMTPVCTV